MSPPNPEERTEIYWKRDRQFQKQQEKLAAWNGSERNKTLIRQFQEHLFAKGSAKYRVAKLTATLRALCNQAGKDLDTMDKREAETLVAQVNRREQWSEHTKSDHRRALKQFFNWFQDDDPRITSQDPIVRENARRLYTYLTKDVRSKPKPASLDYSAMLTDEEIQCLITKGCRTSFERAMISVLAETGCRIGELLGMRLRDIERHDRHAMIRVDGKTGERRIPVVQSIPWLEQWIQDHPHKENGNALLWISIQHRHRGRPMRYYGVRKLLQRVADRAGIQKKHNAHWFRKSRATNIAPRYSESVLCKMLGWTLGSKQVRTYVHLGAQQVEDEFLRKNGLVEEKQSKPLVQFCVCGATNPGDARYCFRCGHALAIATVIEDEAKKKAAIDDDIMWFATKVMTNPELRQQFEDMKTQRRK